MEIIGYIAALFMGAVLGAIGGGGSILTVPILVYLMGVAPQTATGYSLLIVGLTASFGALRYFKMGLINLKLAIIFAIPSIIAVYLTRLLLMPAIPDPILNDPFIIGKDMAIMVFFALLMVLAAIMMLRNANKITPSEVKTLPIFLIMIEGGIVGVVTGILGAGGGFLIIPALVLLIGLPMKEAVGASLLIIALKSLIGFIGDIQAGIHLELPLLPIMIACTILGMWLTTLIAHKFNGQKLQKTFAYFTLVIAMIIIFKEIGG